MPWPRKSPAAWWYLYRARNRRRSCSRRRPRRLPTSPHSRPSRIASRRFGASTRCGFAVPCSASKRAGPNRNNFMPDNTFDVVSKIEMPEVLNAVQQASKEVQTRFDLKDSKSSIEVNEKDNKILLASSDEFKLKAVVEILQSKLVKRKVPLKGLSFGEIIPSAGSTVKQEITLQQGITTENAREIVTAVNGSKLNVQG